MRSRPLALFERLQRGVGRGVVDEVRAGGQLGEVEAGGIEGHALDLQRRGARLVEGQLELIAIEQVDAIVRGVLGGRGDLVQDVVVLR